MCINSSVIIYLYLNSGPFFEQPSVCRNPICQNRARFMLDINKSRYVDFQKVRIQETQAELPRGSIPRRCVNIIGIY